MKEAKRGSVVLSHMNHSGVSINDTGSGLGSGLGMLAGTASGSSGALTPSTAARPSHVAVR